MLLREITLSFRACAIRIKMRSKREGELRNKNIRNCSFNTKIKNKTTPYPVFLSHLKCNLHDASFISY